MIALLKPAFPIESAWLDQVAAIAGADPYLPQSHPIWSALLWLLIRTSLAWHEAAVWLGVLLGALCCALLFLFMQRFRYTHARDERVDKHARGIAALLAVLVALLCAQQQLAAAAAAPHLTGLAFFLASLVVSAGWRYDPKPWRLYLSALLSGLALGEYPSLLWMTLLHAAVWLVRYIRLYVSNLPPLKPSSVKKGIYENRSVRRVVFGLLSLNIFATVGVAGCVLLGLAPLTIQGLLYAEFGPPLFDEARGLVPTLIGIFSRMASGSLSVLPRLGWLYVIALCILPGLVVLSQTLERRPSPARPRDSRKNREIMLWQWVLFAMRIMSAVLIFGGIVVAQLLRNRTSVFDLVPFDTGVGLMFFTAFWIGRWAGGLYVAAAHDIQSDLLPPFFKRIFSPVLAVVLIILLCGASVHFRRKPTDDLEARWRFANEVVRNLDKRTWLVTEGGMDTLLVMAANASGQKLTILNMARNADPVYRDHIASKLEDPELQEICRRDSRAMLTLWAVQPASAIEGTLAILRDGSFWQAAGRTYLPSGLIYLGISATNQPPADKVWRTHEQTWATLAPPANSALAIHASKVANDCGVWLLANGHTNLAARAFAQALAYDTNNLSARLNTVSAGGRSLHESLPNIGSAIAAASATRTMESLRITSGFLAEPQRWVTSGWAWAASGAVAPPPLKLSEAAQRALNHLSEGQRALREGRHAIARACYERAHNSGLDRLALEQLIALDMQTEDMTSLGEDTHRLLKLSPEHHLARYALGYMRFIAREFPEAEREFRASLATLPTSYAWAELARTLWEQNRMAEALAAADAALALSENQANAWSIRGRVLAQKGSSREARHALQQALARNPADADARSTLASLPAP